MVGSVSGLLAWSCDSTVAEERLGLQVILRAFVLVREVRPRAACEEEDHARDERDAASSLRVRPRPIPARGARRARVRLVEAGERERVEDVARVRHERRLGRRGRCAAAPFTAWRGLGGSTLARSSGLAAGDVGNGATAETETSISPDADGEGEGAAA